MDPRLTEYDEHYPQYVQVEQIVSDLITANLRSAHITPMQITHRVKTRESVAGKLVRKSEKYPTLDNMTDLIGFRIICYFSDQVDEIASFLRRLFVVDSKNSIDKRSAIPATAFGYISLHYICTLPRSGAYPEDLCNIPFEFQIKSVLQHTWAEIEHDLGYKTEFGVPREIRREFSRVAGLLEIADELFLNIKEKLDVYKETVRENIANDRAYDMNIDLITLTEYLRHSKTMKALLSEIASITGAVIEETDPEAYIPQLAFFEIHTLGELKTFMETEHDGALLLARNALAGAEIDTLTSIVGLYYLMRSRLTFGNYSEDQIAAFFRLQMDDETRIRNQTQRILKRRGL